MYSLNKIIGYLISPVGFTMALVAAAVLARILGRRRLAGWAVLLALANFWIWSTPWMTQWMGAALESEFLVDGRVPEVESFPQSDAIVLHGGSMGVATNISPYAEMWMSADRVWHGARLYKAGKAPKIFITGGGTTFGTAMLLQDLGVPREAIVSNLTARNTEEEARFIAEAMNEVEVEGRGLQRKVKILLVTSAWHMRRAKLMFEKYAPGLEVIPAATDYEALVRCNWSAGFNWSDLIPNAEMIFLNSYMIHEIIGYWGYRLFRR